jgi:hypothetical protein
MRREIEILISVLTKPERAIELLDANPSYVRAVAGILIHALLWPLIYNYGTYIGEPYRMWLLVVPYASPVITLNLVIMISLASLAGFRGSSYPFKRLFLNQAVLVTYPLNTFAALLLVVELISHISGSFYVAFALMEYGIFFVTGYVAILMACGLVYTRKVSEVRALAASLLISASFIIVGLLLFIKQFSNTFYS